MQPLFQDRRAKIAMAVLLVIVMGYWWNAAWLDNLHRTERKIHAAFGMYRDMMNKRASLASTMLELLNHYAPQEQALSQALSKNYEDAMRYQPPEQILTNAKLAAEFFQLQKSLLDNMTKAQKIAQFYPGLAENRQYFLLQNDWKEVNLQVTGAGELLNRYIIRYNSYLSGFPQNIYNRLTYHFADKTPIVLPKAS